MDLANGENNKFFSFEGVIGRRGFIVNFLIVEIIEGLLWSTPFFYKIILNPDLINIMQSPTKPLWVSLWILFVGLISSVLYFPSIVRRIKDIRPQDNNNFLIGSAIAALLFLSYASAVIPNTYYLSWIGSFILLSLMIIKGNITGAKPKDKIAKFNWGAFFGTWLWGTYNKIWLTLISIPLILTTSIFPFMIICGIKGNEWAYEKNSKKYFSIENFHSSQSKQSVVFSVLAIIISVIGTFMLIFSGMTFTYNYAQKHPEVKEKIISSFQNFQLKAIEASFDKIEFAQDEYKFYMNPKTWNSNKYIKKSSFQNAFDYVLIKQNSFIPAIKGDLDDYYNIMGKVKIYSSFNNEVLAGCVFDEKELKILNEDTKKLKSENSQTSKENIIKILDKACTYNESPTVP